MKANIVTLPGDYIGPEIIAQAVKVLEAVAAKYGHEFYFDERKLGGASIDAFGVPLTDETLAACNAADAVLMGSVGGPKWDAVEPARRPEKGCSPCAKACRCSPICARARFTLSFPARVRSARTSSPSRLTL